MILDHMRGRASVFKNRFIVQLFRSIYQPAQRSLLLRPVQRGVLGHLAVEADVEQQAEPGGGECLEQARVRAAHLVAVQVGEGILADLLEQLLVVDRADEFDAGVAPESRAPLQLVEEPLVDSRDEGEGPPRAGRHELADHRLVVVLGDEAAHGEVVAVRLQAVLLEPSREGGVVVGELGGGRVGAVGDVGGLGREARVLVPDVLLDGPAVADEQVGVLHHARLGELPVPAHRRAPLRAHPFVAVRVDEQGPAHPAYPAGEAPDEGAYPAGEHVEDGLLGAGALGVADRPPKRVEVVGDRPRGPYRAPADAEAVGAVVLVLGLLRHLVDGAGNVVPDAVRRPVLGELLHERLEAPVTGRDALASDDVDVLDPVAHLARPLAVEHRDCCLRYHPQVRREGALLDVGEVHGDHVVERRVAAAPHLPVAGEAGLHGQAAHGALVVLGDLGGQRRARADAGELACEAVEELRELVDRVLADELPDARDARVVLDLEERAVGLVQVGELRQALVGVLVHGAELVHVEGADLPVATDAADALLGVQGVARALETDGDAQDDRGDQEQGDSGEREGDVEGALDEAVGEAAVGALGDGDGPLGLGDQLGGEERHVGSGHRLRIPEGFARLYITALIE